MTTLDWQPNPYMRNAGDTQYQLARTPRFNIWRFYEVGPGQEHRLANSPLPELTDKPGFTPHPDIVLITKGRWNFAAQGLPDGDHVATRGDGAFTVRAAGGYVITTEDPNGNGYVCITPRQAEWFDREIVELEAGEQLVLPARNADTFFYACRGEGTWLSPTADGDIDPNRLTALPAGEDATITATTAILGITFWQRDTFPTSLADLAP